VEEEEEELRGVRKSSEEFGGVRRKSSEELGGLGGCMFVNKEGGVNRKQI
jgi:hypothetical protein